VGDNLVTVKKQRALPFKGELLDSEGLPVTDSEIGDVPPVIQIIYQAATGQADDVTDEALPVGLGTPGNQFEFNGEKWQYNLKITNQNFTAPGIYTVTMVPGDDYVIEPTCQGHFLRQ
jgi:hypothetical protein